MTFLLQPGIKRLKSVQESKANGLIWLIFGFRKKGCLLSHGSVSQGKPPTLKSNLRLRTRIYLIKHLAYIHPT